MPQLRWQRLFLIVTLILPGASALARSNNGLHWEKIHVSNAAPSVVFAKLGLTHSTKNGHTRDGRQGIPDPTFPPGLTDVVPEDAEKLLLVRGTTEGLNLFRARVTAADTRSLPLLLHAELFRQGMENAEPLGTQDQDAVMDGVPAQISLDSGDMARVYQITERSNPDGTLWIACRVSLPLPDQSALSPTGPVYIPERIWTDPISRKIHPGETVVFDDLAAVRQAAARKLGAAGADDAQDYTLRITLTPMATQ